MDNEDQLEAMVNELDQVILRYQSEFPPHSLAGVLLSRVTLLCASDPQTGKGLVKFVWEKLDELEQSDPNSYL
jgi:hypothetical protein